MNNVPLYQPQAALTTGVSHTGSKSKIQELEDVHNAFKNANV